MRVKRLVAGGVCFLLLPASVLPQTAPADAAATRQKMIEALRLQKERRDLPTLNIAHAATDSTPARKLRSSHFRESDSPPLPSRVLPGMPVIYIPRYITKTGDPMEALPTEQSDAIVRGLVTDARAWLTDDQSAIYSEFNIRVDQVLKPNAAVAIGQEVTALRWGGALQLPAVLMKVRQADQIMPVVGGNYLLFLKHYSKADPAFTIVTGYRLESGVATALDILPENMRFEGSSEAALFAALEAKLP